LIFTGRQLGTSLTTLSRITGLSLATVARRHDAATHKIANGLELAKLSKQVLREYNRQES